MYKMIYTQSCDARERKRDGTMHTAKKEDTMIVESITLLHFKWPKKCIRI